MVEGEKRRLWMPAALAYGNAPGGPSEDLVLDLELMAIPEPPPAPPDVKAPPKDATKLASSLAYKILSHGNGDKHPTATSRVTIDYTAQKLDEGGRRMFRQLRDARRALTIGLRQVIRRLDRGRSR